MEEYPIENMEKYPVEMEVEGPYAMFARADGGSVPASYPFPTWSASKGMFENILYLKNATVIPYRVDICFSPKFLKYGTNYNGPFRKPDLIKKEVAHQCIATIVVNKPCYKLYAYAVDYSNVEPTDRSTFYQHINSAHSYQAQFTRRLRKERPSFNPVFLGRSEFLADYVGPFRNETKSNDTINMVFYHVPKTPGYDGTAPEIYEKVEIKKGILYYAK